jgi:hypothetical protein
MLFLRKADSIALKPSLRKHTLSEMTGNLKQICSDGNSLLCGCGIFL